MPWYKHITLTRLYCIMIVVAFGLFVLNKLVYDKMSTTKYDVSLKALLTHNKALTWIDNPRMVRSRRTKTIYPLDYGLQYSKNSKICPKGIHISLLFMVHSAPSNFQDRGNIRKTYTNQTFFPNHEIRTVFLLGTTTNNQTQLKIEEEQRTFGDIVQGYFHDSYNNLTLKAVTGLKWISKHCSNVSLVAKIDDDTFVQTFKLLEEVLPVYKHRHILCNVWPKKVMRILRKGKWKVPDIQLKNYKTFPWTYCSGFAVVMTGDLIPLLHKASVFSPFLWVDDVYFSGILTSKIEKPHFQNIRLGVKSDIHEPRITNCFKQPDCPYLFTGSRQSSIEELWKLVLEHRQNGTHI